MRCLELKKQFIKESTPFKQPLEIMLHLKGNLWRLSYQEGDMSLSIESRSSKH